MSDARKAAERLVSIREPVVHWRDRRGPLAWLGRRLACGVFSGPGIAVAENPSNVTCGNCRRTEAYQAAARKAGTVDCIVTQICDYMAMDTWDIEDHAYVFGLVRQAIDAPRCTKAAPAMSDTARKAATANYRMTRGIGDDWELLDDDYSNIHKQTFVIQQAIDAAKCQRCGGTGRKQIDFPRDGSPPCKFEFCDCPLGEAKAEAALWRERCNKELTEADDFSCSVASALGWNSNGKPFDQHIREIVAENTDLRAEVERWKVAREFISHGLQDAEDEVKRLRAEVKRLSRRNTGLTKLGHDNGWDGVGNSKLLDEFLATLIADLKARITKLEDTEGHSTLSYIAKLRRENAELARQLKSEREKGDPHDAE